MRTAGSSNLRVAAIAVPIAVAAVVYAVVAPQHPDNRSPDPRACFAATNKTMGDWAEEYPTHSVRTETADKIVWQVEGARSTTLVTFERDGELWHNTALDCL